MSLESLELSENVTDEFLNQLDRLPQFTELALHGPNVTDATARLLAESAPNLKTLYLRHANLTVQGIRWISELSDLEVLALDETEVGDDAIEHLAKLEKLRWLDLSGADSVTDRSLEVIGKLRNMRQLFLMGTQVSTGGLGHLRGLNNLRHLDLQSTKVRSIPPWLEARPMLHISLD